MLHYILCVCACVSAFCSADDFLFVTIPRSGSNVMQCRVLPVIIERKSPSFIHTWSEGEIQERMQANPTQKCILLVRQPEDMILSFIYFIDKKVSYGDATPVHHQEPQAYLDYWKALSFEEKCWVVTTSYEQHCAVALSLLKDYEPLVITYEEIIYPAHQKKAAQKMARYLNAYPISHRKVAQIRSGVSEPTGFEFRKGGTGDGKRTLPPAILKHIERNDTFRTFKQTFGYTD